MEEQINCINRAVTVLSDNQLGMLVLCLGIIVILAVQEGYNIRILLQRAGFTQVTQHRALHLTRFDATAKLRQRQHRHIQLTRQCLQRA